MDDVDTDARAMPWREANAAMSMTPSQRTMRSIGRPYVGQALLELARDIKLSHTVFAMPFALLAAFLAWPEEWSGIRFALALGLVMISMVSARTAAMLANRVLDSSIDRENPRTAGRALPSGRVTKRDALTVFFGSSVVFFAACAAFGLILDNWWPLTLGPVVLGWICAYPLLKRFSSLCHLYLGSSLAISPLAATIAVNPALLGSAEVWLLAGYVMFWVAGFDVIYALQDVELDKAQGVFSLPSRLGTQRALAVSRAIHAIGFTLLCLMILLDRHRLWPLMGIGAGLVGVLLAIEHLVATKGGARGISLAFFTINGIISCVLGGLGIVSVMAARA